jgi:hypothetical protein
MPIHTRFGKRRSDHFAMFCQSSQLLGRPPFLSCHHNALRLSNRKFRILDRSLDSKLRASVHPICEGDGHDIWMSSLPHLNQPKGFSETVFFEPCQERREQGAKVAIFTFTDTDQSRAPTAR